MSFKENEYINRLVDKNIEKYLDTFGAISVEGPKFMCIITSNFSSVVKDPETGIYILPITALKP